jgi:DNA polymerase I-like protein with 3'-5' exonuclease and polymerase domains
MRTFWSERPGTPGFQRWCHGVTEKLDLYVEVGKETGKIPPHFSVADCKGIEALDEGIKGRKQSKITNLSLGYGTGKLKYFLYMIIDTGLMQSREETDAAHSLYWARLRKVRDKLDDYSELANPTTAIRTLLHPFTRRETTWAETLGGRKRFYREDNPAWWTTGRNMPIQGTAGGDILKHASVLLTRWAWENAVPGGLVNMIHDEFIFETTPEWAERVQEKMERVMSEVGEAYCPTVPIGADGYIAEHWVKD